MDVVSKGDFLKALRQRQTRYAGDPARLRRIRNDIDVLSSVPGDTVQAMQAHESAQFDRYDHAFQTMSKATRVSRWLAPAAVTGIIAGCMAGSAAGLLGAVVVVGAVGSVSALGACVFNGREKRHKAVAETLQRYRTCLVKDRQQAEQDVKKLAGRVVDQSLSILLGQDTLQVGSVGLTVES